MKLIKYLYVIQFELNSKPFFRDLVHLVVIKEGHLAVAIPAILAHLGFAVNAPKLRWTVVHTFGAIDHHV